MALAGQEVIHGAGLHCLHTVIKNLYSIGWSSETDIREYVGPHLPS
jgi:hypothetical protein